MKEVLALVAAGIAVAGNVPYLRDVVRGRAQPHPYTWLAWTLVTGVTFFGQVAAGAGPGALPTAVSGAFTLAIFGLSLRQGFRNVTKSDALFLGAALLGLVPWALTKDPTWSVAIAVCIDLVAFVPTIRKTWRRPETETPLLYLSNVLRHALALAALDAYNVATMLHSVAMVATNALMSGILLRRKR